MKRRGTGCSAECGGLGGADAAPCQGEGRGFESRRPLSVKHLLSTSFDWCVGRCGLLAVPMVCPWFAHGLPMVCPCPWSPYGWVMTGSLRQRGPDTWELRVYLGVDQDGGRERWASTRPFTARDATRPPVSASSSKTPDMPGCVLARWLICLIGGCDRRR